MCLLILSLKDKFAKNRTRWPTFSEFTEFLLDEAQHNKELDMHWTEITKFCTPCQVHFDIIAKFETLDEDQKYLIHRAKLENLITPQWKNSGKGKNTQDLLMKYYAELTQKQVHAVYELFRYDFELFDYSPKAFFDVAKVDDAESIDSDGEKMSKNF
jgi:Sulfotransferase family